MCNSTSAYSTKNMIALGVNFQPSEFDVLCFRGKLATQHPGNRRFRMIVQQHLSKYAEATSKFEKTVIVSEIVEAIKESSPNNNGGFVKKQDGQWFQCNEHLAREKVSQALRDMLAHKYSSSTKAKKMRRNVKRIMLHDEVDQILEASAYKNFADRVEQLTLKAKNDLDYQIAFNTANMELLKAFKIQT